MKSIKKNKKQEEMRLEKENNMNWEERYFNGEIDYVDERCVSLEMTKGTEDCMEYLDENKVDDNTLWFKREANSGEFYREPFCSEIGASSNNTYTTIK